MIVVIPAYKPDEKLIALTQNLLSQTDYEVVVVNDGSGKGFDPIFAALPKDVIQLRHDVNRGKGAAMKTAIRFILDNMSNENGMVFADADGQHLIKDIIACTKALKAHPDALVIGSREFKGNVPLHNRLGNHITLAVFAVASGKRIHDTQTGLRAFSLETAKKFADLEGDRYEYEMHMLMAAAQQNIPFHEVTIETVYLDENKSSHFNVFRDSFKIYRVIFKYSTSLKFVASSLVSFLLDFILLLIFNALLPKLGMISLNTSTSLTVSVILARVISAFCNYTLNRTLVFKHDGSKVKSLAQYAGLAAVILAANALLMNLFVNLLGWWLVPSKLLVECTLYIASFFIQKLFIFK